VWQRFTERARRVVFFAQEEAGRLGENYVSTEHLLLGLVRENDSVAARVLDKLGVPQERVREELVPQIVASAEPLSKEMHLTPRAKRVIDLAYEEARSLHNNYMGTEHLLLGLIREGGDPDGGGLAGRTLAKLGVTLEAVRQVVTELQEARPEARLEIREAEHESRPPWSREHLLQQIRHLLAETVGSRATLSADEESGFVERVVQALRESLPMTLPPQLPTAGDTSPGLRPGDFGVLGAPEGRDRVEFATTPEDFVALTEAYAARDHHGYHDLVAESEQAAARVLLLKAGTSVKLLVRPRGPAARTLRDAHFVRVLDGTYAGKSGWIRSNSFDRIGPDLTPFPPTAES